MPTEPPATRWRSNSDWIALRRSRCSAARSNSCACRRLLHLRLLVGLDLAVAAGEEVDDRVDVAPVLVLADVADAGRPAALDVVVEAGAAGAAAGLGSLAGAELEQLAEQVERLPHPLGAGEGAEVGAAGAVLLAGEVDARVVLVEADADVGVGLVVAQADVEARPVALDEALLGEQRLGLVGGDEDVDPVDPRGEAGLAAGEVRGDPLADRARLADVEQLAARVVEEVDAGRRRAARGAAAPSAPREGSRVAFAHRPKGRLLASRPTSTPETESEMTTETLNPPELNTLRIEVDGEIGTLTLDRPDAFNAMSPEMIGELGTAFAWLADQAPLRALIVTGAGKAFCSGGDINWFKTGVEDDSIDLPAQVRRGAEALHTGDRRPAPDPLSGDLPRSTARRPAPASRWRSPATSASPRRTAFLASAYGRIGASPDGGMTYFLPRVVGPSRALEILLEDPNMKAAESARGGPRLGGRRARRADGRRPGEGREARREGAPLREDGEAALRRRASRTASPSTCSWSATGSPTAWRPRTCAKARSPSSAARSRCSRAAEPRSRLPGPPVSG